MRPTFKEQVMNMSSSRKLRQPLDTPRGKPPGLSRSLPVTLLLMHWPCALVILPGHINPKTVKKAKKGHVANKIKKPLPPHNDSNHAPGQKPGASFFVPAKNN